MPIKLEKSLAKEHPILSYINSTYFAFASFCALLIYFLQIVFLPTPTVGFILPLGRSCCWFFRVYQLRSGGGGSALGLSLSCLPVVLVVSFLLFFGAVNFN